MTRYTEGQVRFIFDNGGRTLDFPIPRGEGWHETILNWWVKAKYDKVIVIEPDPIDLSSGDLEVILEAMGKRFEFGASIEFDSPVEIESGPGYCPTLIVDLEYKGGNWPEFIVRGNHRRDGDESPMDFKRAYRRNPGSSSETAVILEKLPALLEVLVAAYRGTPSTLVVDEHIAALPSPFHT